MKEHHIGLLKRTLKTGEVQAITELIESSFQLPSQTHLFMLEGPFEQIEGTIRYHATFHEYKQELLFSISTTKLKENVDVSIFPSLKQLLGDPSEIFIVMLKEENIPQITFKYGDILFID